MEPDPEQAIEPIVQPENPPSLPEGVDGVEIDLIGDIVVRQTNGTTIKINADIPPEQTYKVPRGGIHLVVSESGRKDQEIHLYANGGIYPETTSNPKFLSRPDFDAFVFVRFLHATLPQIRGRLVHLDPKDPLRSPSEDEQNARVEESIGRYTSVIGAWREQRKKGGLTS